MLNDILSVDSHDQESVVRKDVLQIENYKKLLQKMGFKVRETVLVYVNNQHNDIDIVVS